jgi:plastocyanin
MRAKVLLALCLLVIAACGGAGGAEPVGGTIEVTGVEYEFQGVPELVAPGAEFTFTNGGEEVHEMIVVQVIEGETRTLEEILELPEAESDALISQFMGFLIDTPSGETFNPEGDSTSITVTEPGRYAVVCFLPQGLDEETFESAMAEADPDAEGPPPFPEGTPHALLGMAAEFTVEGDA